MARKNRRPNELKTSLEYLTIEGRTIKHHALIDHFANPNINKLRDSPIDLVGVDIETEPSTGEMRLMGFYDITDTETYEGKEYYYHDPDLFIPVLFQRIKMCAQQEKALAFWNKLDAFQFLRLLLTHSYDETREIKSLLRFSKVAGEFDKDRQEWEIEPVVMLKNEMYEFGIVNVIRSNIQFYIKLPQRENIIKVWAYDFSPFYQGHLALEAKRFDWYYKGADELHLVDWNRFHEDKPYQKEVIASNMRDARVAGALGYEMQKQFSRGYYGHYSVSIMSEGALARTAIVAVQRKILEGQGLSGKDLEDTLYDNVSSVRLMYHYDRWVGLYGETFLKDLLCMISEAYSGGEIEAVRYGYAEKGYIADLTAAYPANAEQLEDLRDCDIEYGKGAPPVCTHGYMFIRGVVKIPKTLQYHPITIKSPTHKDTNIRATGIFSASYMWEEREFCLEYGAEFTEETWYWIKTKGVKSPIAQMISVNNQIRENLRAKGDNSEQRVKRISASAYGITYECVDTYKEVDGELMPRRNGYRAGEFYNPIYASSMTARTRVALSKGAMEVEQNGGKVILLMTDSVTWAGTREQFPNNFKLPFGECGVKMPKTIGWFEEPVPITDIVCLGSGRYGFKTPEGNTETKRRGLNIVGYSDTDGISVEDRFNWLDVLKLVKQFQSLTLKLNVRVLTSAGMIAHRNEMNVFDLGKIIEEERTIEVIAGHAKRMYSEDVRDPNKLATTLCDTEAWDLHLYMYGKRALVDGTHRTLRDLMMKKTVVTRKERKQATSRNTSERHYKGTYKPSEKYQSYKKEKRIKYDAMKKIGLSPEYCKILCDRSWENIKEFLIKGGYSTNTLPNDELEER